MAKLRRLTGKEVIKILQDLGYEVIRIKGSHYRLRLQLDETTCYTTVPMHGNSPLATATLRAIYRQVVACLDEDIVHPHFYTE